MKREYRKLDISDIGLVLNINRDFREGFAFDKNARQFLSNPMNWIVACIQDEKIIGFTYGYELNRLDNKGNMVYIHEVSVLPDCQRQGIGSEILNTIKKICKLAGISRFFLITQKHNDAACKLYEKAGGKKSSTHDDDVTYSFNNFELH